MTASSITQARVEHLAELRAQGLTIQDAALQMNIKVRAAERYASIWNRQQRARAEHEALPTPAPPAPAVWHWTDASACRGHEGLFFAPDREDTVAREIRETKARSLCARCPVLWDCRERVLNLEGHRSRRYLHGVWAELNEDERAAEKRIRDNDQRNARRRVTARRDDSEAAA